VGVTDDAETGGGAAPTTEAERLADESTEAFAEAVTATTPEDQQAKLDYAQKAAEQAALAGAYTHLQRVIGIIAVLLPPVLVLGNMAFNGWVLKGSISAYYYTTMGSVFVGALCALAVFFLSYNYRPLPSFELDNILSTIASVAAVGVAVFPTTSNAAQASGGDKAVAFVHLAFAGLLFVLLAVFSYYLFTLSSGPMTERKRQRNRLFRACGLIIAASIALVLVTNAVDPPSEWHALLWLETVCVEAFGVSWLVKSGFLGILADS
jgi:hypothetical protein